MIAVTSAPATSFVTTPPVAPEGDPAAGYGSIAAQIACAATPSEAYVQALVNWRKDTEYGAVGIGA